MNLCQRRKKTFEVFLGWLRVGSKRKRGSKYNWCRKQVNICDEVFVFTPISILRAFARSLKVHSGDAYRPAKICKYPRWSQHSVQARDFVTPTAFWGLSRLTGL
ncbi:hypothetical protein PoB_006028800 [Plakobranchus ocellatus]|uniref:Uncharacterized protein n=1 Tax=Plakobranchus ocellatus TaxID=259542 RepID=A0AAV4CPJ5_9GAST|nr:hypothetical protein PoB_006028800 [Plakobranchus ocellatus]